MNTQTKPPQDSTKKSFPRWIIAMVSIILAVLVASIALMSDEPTPPTSTNPTENEGDISWQEATSLIHSCEVDMAFQTHNLKVTLTLKDGTRVTTKEPEIDDVFKVVEEAQPTCGTIPLATE